MMFRKLINLRSMAAWPLQIGVFCLLLRGLHTFSCHQCRSVIVEEVTKDEAKHYRSQVDRCIDYDGTAACIANLRKGLCFQTVVDMKSRCNSTCDLCRFKESGELQPYDVQYWSSQNDFQETFLMLNTSLVSVESSSYVEGLEAVRAIDGNLTSFFETNFISEPYIVVNLGSSYSVYNVYIINRWGKNITRQNIISLDQAKVTALWIPPLDSKTTGNSTYCGEIRVRTGFTLDQQTYKVACSSRPVSTHVKLHRVDYSKLEISEFKVGVIDEDNQCGKSILSKCDPYLGSDRCYKSELTGIWHGKRIVYTERGCYYPNKSSDTNCGALTSRLNKQWQHLKSHYTIDGAYDPNSFAMTTCDQHLCDSDQCNGIDKLLGIRSYLIVILLAISEIF